MGVLEREMRYFAMAFEREMRVVLGNRLPTLEVRDTPTGEFCILGFYHSGFTFIARALIRRWVPPGDMAKRRGMEGSSETACRRHLRSEDLLPCI